MWRRIFIIFMCLTLIVNVSHAKSEIIETKGTYVMDLRLDETPATAMSRAREEAKRKAVEQAGTYIESYTKTVDMMLDVDEIRTIAAQVIKIQDEHSSQKLLQDNLLEFTVTIKALVDDSDGEMLKAKMADKQSLEESTRRNNELQKEYDELKRQMDELKAKYNTANEAQKAAIKAETAKNNERFKAITKLDNGNGYYATKDYVNALNAYNEALRLNPQLTEAYNNRGLTYYHMRRLSEAANDFDNAIRYNAGFAQAYNNRGMVRNALGQQAAAIQDYSTALQLKSNFAEALNNRGNAYIASGQYQNAIVDLQAALRIMSNNAEVHNNLGSAYMSIENNRDALNEFTRAIQLKSDYADAYYNRCIVYYKLGDYNAAMKDVKRASELNPNDTATRDLYNTIKSKIGG